MKEDASKQLKYGENIGASVFAVLLLQLQKSSVHMSEVACEQ